MAKKVAFIGVLVLLGVALFLSPDFKVVAFGVAILLFGMILLEEGFRAFTKGPLQEILKKATNKLYKSISIGVFMTALIQSSSLLTVIAISFISAGLIDLAAGIGIVFGANIGTTATDWLVAGFGLHIQIASLSMPMLVFGTVLAFQKKSNLKAIGNILIGLGFFFLGIHYMKEGFDTFKDSFDLAKYAIPGFLGLVVFTFLGIIITTILQSSSATLALILTSLAVGQITYHNALALAIGANIGTTITAVIGAISANVEGRRLAGAHMVFNMVTGIVALVFIYPLANAVDFITSGIGIAEDNYTLKLATFHTIFNTLGVIIMIPFIKRLEKLLLKVFKSKIDEGDIEQPKFLNMAVLEYPATALEAILNETKFLFKNATFEIVAHGLNLHRDDIKSDISIKKIIKMSDDDIDLDVDEIYYRKVKNIYSKIIKYVSYIQFSFKMSPDIAEALTKVKIANRKIVEIIKSMKGIQKNVDIYTASDNKYIKKEYDKLRKKAFKVMRETYLLRKDDEPEKRLKKLEELQIEIEADSIFTNGTIDNLIREQKISSSMASSLINDADTVSSMIENFIEIAIMLYGKKDRLLEDNKKFDEKGLEVL
jgi:phosphate:Na+ symporter